jgi:hypothetical protein
MPQAQPSREELIEARERLKEQLFLVANPIRGRDRNPQLAAKLQAMIDDIEYCLSEPVTDNA